MTANAGLIFKNNPLSENRRFFDGNTGQSITLEELAERRRVEQIQKFQGNFSVPITALREENWLNMLGKLRNLFDVEYDEDFLEPSQHILKRVAELLFEANSFFVNEMSLPIFVVPDGEGGIRVEWKLNNKHLRMVCSPHRNYLYLENTSVPQGLENFNIKQLIESLRWLNQI